MIFKRLLWMALVPAMAVISLAAQEQVPSGAAIFAPFVTRLEGEARNNLVRLTWTDSPDARGPVYIYRSPSPFDGPLSTHNIRPVEIPYGTQSYIDEIETAGTVYYFAAASDGTGLRYEIPVSPGNTIGVQVAGSESAAPSVEPRRQAAEPRAIPGAAEVQSIDALVQEDRVTVTFAPGDRNVTLYRSTRPVRATADLLSAVIVQTKAISPFTDFPAPGIPYYYAVIAEEDLIRGAVEIIPGRNATQRPVVVSAARGGSGTDSRDRVVRAMPLPQVTAGTAVPGLSARTERPPMELSPQASQALGDIPARPQSGTQLKSPRVFARDMENSPAGGEAYALSQIVRGSFFAKKWDAAGEELISFLTLPRSPDVKGRAQFYLGQCHYFRARPREALFEFLAIRDRFPAEAAEWIQASLDLIRE